MNGRARGSTSSPGSAMRHSTNTFGARRNIQVVTLGFGRMQLDYLSGATPAFPVRGIAHDRLRRQRIFARLDGEGFPTLIGPAARERHALHDDGDGKPQGRHGFATMMKHDRIAARSYTSHAGGNPRRREAAKTI